MEVATQEEQLQQRVGLGNVVKIDLPTIDVGLFQAVENCRHIGKVRRIIVLMAVGGGRMDEPAVGPGLAWRRSEPVVADREFLGELRQHRQLGGRENNASRFSDRRFVAGLIAVGRDNFGQSRPWWVSDPAQARSCRTVAC